MAAVAPHEDDEGQPEPLGGLELLHVHEEAAIPGEAHDLAAAMAAGSPKPMAANPLLMSTVLGAWGRR